MQYLHSLSQYFQGQRFDKINMSVNFEQKVHLNTKTKGILQRYGKRKISLFIFKLILKKYFPKQKPGCGLAFCKTCLRHHCLLPKEFHEQVAQRICKSCYVLFLAKLLEYDRQAEFQTIVSNSVSLNKFMRVEEFRNLYLNIKDSQGFSILHYACMYKRDACASFLLELRADPDGNNPEKPPMELLFNHSHKYGVETQQIFETLARAKASMIEFPNPVLGRFQELVFLGEGRRMRECPIIVSSAINCMRLSFANLPFVVTSKFLEHLFAKINVHNKMIDTLSQFVDTGQPIKSTNDNYIVAVVLIQYLYSIQILPNQISLTLADILGSQHDSSSTKKVVFDIKRIIFCLPIYSITLLREICKFVGDFTDSMAVISKFSEVLFKGLQTSVSSQLLLFMIENKKVLFKFRLESIAYEPDVKSDKMCLKYATIDSIVDIAVSEGSKEEFLEKLLLMYPYFCTAEKLFSSLRRNYFQLLDKSQISWERGNSVMVQKKGGAPKIKFSRGPKKPSKSTEAIDAKEGESKDTKSPLKNPRILKTKKENRVSGWKGDFEDKGNGSSPNLARKEQSSNKVSEIANRENKPRTPSYLRSASEMSFNLAGPINILTGATSVNTSNLKSKTTSDIKKTSVAFSTEKPTKLIPFEILIPSGASETFLFPLNITFDQIKVK